MEFALNCKNEKIHASKADKKQEFFCPICHRKVIPRQGQVNVYHFAHTSKCEDDWNYDMSEWHSLWQNQFPKKNQEVVVELKGEKHRADVMACGYIIEFQHSPITAEEFNKRNAFYLSYGKKVIWIFDFIDDYRDKQLECYDEWEKGGKYKWRYPKRFLQDYLPQRDKNIIVFFQISDSNFADKEMFYMERVTWAIEEEGISDFKRFWTLYYPGNAFELLEAIKQRSL